MERVKQYLKEEKQSSSQKKRSNFLFYLDEVQRNSQNLRKGEKLQLQTAKQIKRWK